MTKGEMLREAQYVDLSDDDLKELLGFLWEAIKRETELMKNDEQIAELAAKIKELKQDKYGDAIKTNKKRLKAARFIASTRNIEWKLPREK